MLFEVVDHFQIDFNVFVGIKSEVCEEGVKVLHEVAEDGDLGLLLDERDGLGDQPFLGGDAGDALIDKGEAEWR